MRKLFEEIIESIKKNPHEWREVPRSSDRPFALGRNDVEIMCDGSGVSAIDGIVAYGGVIHKARFKEKRAIKYACKEWLVRYKSRVMFGLGG